MGKILVADEDALILEHLRAQTYPGRLHRRNGDGRAERRQVVARHAAQPGARPDVDHPPVINHRDDAHGVLAERAAQRVHMPDPEDQVLTLCFAAVGLLLRPQNVEGARWALDAAKLCLGVLLGLCAQRRRA